MEQSINEKTKKLKHVKVYNRLYSMIQDGIYPPGSQLPSESKLAEQMNVSRMTLRRALALLQEDNLVNNIQGKGNFINDKDSDTSAVGMETTQHPVYASFSGTLDNVELEFRLEPPTDSITECLKRKCAAVVIADRWYKQSEKASVYSLSFIPIEIISELLIDLNHSEELLSYLEHAVYDIAVTSSCIYNYTTTGNFTAAKYILSHHASFLLIQETVYDKNHRVLVFSKHYIPIELFKMQIHTASNNTFSTN